MKAIADERQRLEGEQLRLTHLRNAVGLSRALEQSRADAAATAAAASATAAAASADYTADNTRKMAHRVPTGAQTPTTAPIHVCSPPSLALSLCALIVPSHRSSRRTCSSCSSRSSRCIHSSCRTR